jgi:hypothetical protein
MRRASPGSTSGQRPSVRIGPLPSQPSVVKLAKPRRRGRIRSKAVPSTISAPAVINGTVPPLGFDVSGMIVNGRNSPQNNRGWCRPYDADGRRRDFDDIPRAVSDLVDDPYRSLAGELRQAGGFAKDTTREPDLRQTTTAEVRLDEGKATSSSGARRATRRFACEQRLLRSIFIAARPAETGRSHSRHRASGQCRFV